MFLQILTSKSSWLFHNKKKILKEFTKVSKIQIIHKSEYISSKANIVFVLSYYKIIPLKNLNKNQNIYVIHDSDLPLGRGMSPLFNQILNGEKNITSTIFKCEERIDDGKIIFKKKFFYPDNLIYNEIKNFQMKNNIFIIKKFISLFLKKNIKFKIQKGKIIKKRKIRKKFKSYKDFRTKLYIESINLGTFIINKLYKKKKMNLYPQKITGKYYKPIPNTLLKILKKKFNN